MTKRLLSLAFSLLFVCGIIPLGGIEAFGADNTKYSVDNAIAYAEKNWNNGIGLCADFASKCLRAGGLDIYGSTVSELYSIIKDTHGVSYKLVLTNGTSGRIRMSDNEGKLSKGDPIFYKCNYCGDFEHVVICNGANAEGYAQDYAHNKAHNGKKTTYTYNHCGGDSWTMYSVKMFTGSENKPDAPVIKAVSNGEGGVVINWGAVEGAEKYRIYRKTGKGSFKKIGTTKNVKFTDKNVQNGKKYTYAIKTVVGDEASQRSKGKSITCLGITRILSAYNTNSGIKIKWNPVSSADGYYVYRKNADGKWERIAKVKGSVKSAYTDKTVENTKSYQYTIRAYDGKVKGCFSKKGIKETFLSAPTDIATKSSESGIVVTFAPVSGADKYRIYKKTASNGWIESGTLEGENSTTFVDVSAEHAKSYTYMVKAFLGEKISSYKSDEVIAKHIVEK